MEKDFEKNRERLIQQRDVFYEREGEELEEPYAPEMAPQYGGRRPSREVPSFRRRMEEERVRREEERAHKELIKSLNDLSKASATSATNLRTVVIATSQLEKQFRELKSILQELTENASEFTEVASSSKRELRGFVSDFGRTARGFRMSVAATTNELRSFRQSLKRSVDYFLSLPSKTIEKLNLDLAMLSSTVKESFKEAVESLRPELKVQPITIPSMGVLVTEVQKVRESVKDLKMDKQLRDLTGVSEETLEQTKESAKQARSLSELADHLSALIKERRAKEKPGIAERLIKKAFFVPRFTMQSTYYFMKTLLRGVISDLFDAAFAALGPIGQVLRSVIDQMIWSWYGYHKESEKDEKTKKEAEKKKSAKTAMPWRLAALRPPHKGEVSQEEIAMTFGPFSSGPIVPWRRKSKKEEEEEREYVGFYPSLFATQLTEGLGELALETATLYAKQAELKQDRDAKIIAKSLRIDTRDISLEGVEVGRSFTDKIIDLLGIRAILKRGGPIAERVPGGIGRVGKLGRVLGFIAKRTPYVGAILAGVGAFIEGANVPKILTRAATTLTGGVIGAIIGGPIGAVVGSVLGEVISEKVVEPVLPKIGGFAESVYEGMKKVLKTNEWIGTLVSAFTSAWESVKSFFGSVWGEVRKGIDKIEEVISNIWRTVSDIAKKAFGIVEGVAEDIKKTVSEAYDTAKDVVNEGINYVNKGIDVVSNAAKSVSDTASKTAQQLYDYVTKREITEGTIAEQIGVKLTPIIKQIIEAQKMVVEGPGAVMARFETGLGATVKDIREASAKVSHIAGIYGYGIPQFTPESVKEFLEKTAFKEYFKDVVPGTTEFAKRWVEVAKDPRIGKAFAEAQLGYVREKFLTPVARYAQEHWGLVIEKSKALQEALLARAVQLGPQGAIRLLGEAFKGLSREEIGGMSEEDLIRRIYQVQRDLLPRFFKTVLSRDPSLQRSLSKRFAEEEEAVLYLSKLDRHFNRVITTFESIPHYEPPPVQQVTKVELPIGVFDQLQEDFASIRSSFEGMGIETPVQPVFDYYPEDLMREAIMARERVVRAETDKQKVVAETIASSMTEQLKPEALAGGERTSPFPMIAGEEFNRVPLMVDDIAILMLQLGLN